MTDAFLGVDIGTEAVRVLAITADGTLAGSATAPLETAFPRDGWAEQDPIAVWEAVEAAVTLAAASGARVRALALASTSASVTAVDARDNPLGPTLLWMDTRAAAEAAEISRSGHPCLWYTGGSVSAEWGLAKALWLARHDRSRYDAALRIVELHDWVVHRLSGVWTAGLGLACSGWSHVPELGGWPEQLLRDLGLDRLLEGWPAEPMAPGAAVGRILPEVAARLRLPQDVVVGQGTMDTFAAATACNVFEPGRLALSMGSSSAYVAVMDEPRSDGRVLGPVPGAFGRGTWAMYGGQTSAGSALRWFQRELAPGATLATLDAEAAAVPIGAHGVHALDTLQGSRTPHRDPLRRGAFWGIGLAHGRAALYRALLEAVALGGRLVTAALADLGIPTGAITACGGGSRSALWMQIHADALNCPIATLDTPDAAALGAAMCAAVAARTYPDLASAAREMGRAGPTYRPELEAAAAYASLADEYERVDGLLAPPASGAARSVRVERGE